MARICIISAVHQALDNRVFHREACSLRDAGHDVTLLAVHPHDEEVAGIHLLAVPRRPRWQRPGLWRWLTRRALATNADIYHLHDPELLLTVLPELRRRSGRPVIYDAHESCADFTAIKEDIPAVVRLPLATAIRRLEPWLARRANGLITADQAIAADLAHLRIPQTVIFNFPLRSFVEQAATAIRPARERGQTIIYLGGIKRHRGAFLMLDAFARVRERLPTARLLLVGPFLPPRLEPEIRAEIVRRGLTDAVQTTGAVPFSAVGGHLAGATVGWVPLPGLAKYHKNIPTKLFEYYAYGLPAVASDLRSLPPFMRHGETGLLAPPEDPAAHAEALLALLDDPERAATMGEAGRQKVIANWNWTPMAHRLAEFYQRLLDKPQPATSTTP